MERTGDRSLSKVLLGRAGEFLAGAAAAAGRADVGVSEAQLQLIRISLELSLKAVILQLGGSDERSGVEIRYSLIKTLAPGETVGFSQVPGVPEAAQRLSPYYETHILRAIAPAFRSMSARR